MYLKNRSDWFDFDKTIPFKKTIARMIKYTVGKDRYRLGRKFIFFTGIMMKKIVFAYCALLMITLIILEKYVFDTLNIHVFLMDSIFVFLFWIVLRQIVFQSIKEFAFFVGFHILFNSMVLSIHFSKHLLDDRSLATGTLVHPWGLIFYYFSYFDEFAKRSLIGTIFRILHLDVNFENVFLFSIFVLNIFFVMFYLLTRKATENSDRKLFYFVLTLFLFSPATVVERGIYIIFYDNFNLIVTAIAVYLLIREENRYIYIILPILIGVGVLVHEAFLLINLPLIFAIMINEVHKGRKDRQLLINSTIMILFVVGLILMYGKIDDPKVFSRIHSLLPIESWAASEDVFMIWGRGLKDNFYMALQEYKYDTFLSLIPVAIITTLYLFLFMRMLRFDRLDTFEKLVLLSPMTALSLFIIAHDFARFFALMTVMFFFAFIYLLSIRKETIQMDRTTLIYSGFLFLSFFMGPYGVMSGFPYLEKFFLS